MIYEMANNATLPFSELPTNVRAQIMTQDTVKIGLPASPKRAASEYVNT